MKYLLVTAGEDLPPHRAMAEALAAGLGLDPATAAMTARKGWGVLGAGLEDAQVERLETACAGAGLKVLRIPGERLPPLPKPLPVRKVIFSGGKAYFSGPEGFSAAAVPEALGVLAAAPVKTESVIVTTVKEESSVKEKALRMGIMAVTGLPIGLGGSKEVKKEVRSTETHLTLDLLTADGRSRLRLQSGDLDFSGLGEKKTYSSQLNFRLLASELGSFAKGAFRNAYLKAMLAGGQLSTLPYEGLPDLEKETARLALARGIKLAQGGGGK